MHKIIRDFIDTIVHAFDARITREKDENIYIYIHSSNHCESKLIDEWNIIYEIRIKIFLLFSLTILRYFSK